MIIKAEVDGLAIVKMDNEIVEKRALSAGQKTELDKIFYRSQILLFQGLDLVWRAQYERIKQLNQADEPKLLARLSQCKGKEVQVAHSLGATAEWLQEYPMVRAWLYKKIRTGTIPEDALEYLKRFIGKQKNLN